MLYHDIDICILTIGTFRYDCPFYIFLCVCIFSVKITIESEHHIQYLWLSLHYCLFNTNRVTYPRKMVVSIHCVSSNPDVGKFQLTISLLYHFTMWSHWREARAPQHGQQEHQRSWPIASSWCGFIL